MNHHESILSKGQHYAVYNYPAESSFSDVPYLILLHGFLGSAHVFDPLISLLRKEYHIISIDLLGHGKTTGSIDPNRYKADRQISDLYEIITHIISQKPGRIYLYGYSMGGRLAMRFAITYPDLIEQLILESASPGMVDEEDRSGRYELDKKRAAKILSDFEGFLSKWEQAALFQNPAHTANANEIEAYRKIQRSQSPAYMAACLQGFSPGIQLPVHEELKNSGLPISLIAGKNDEKYSKLYKQLHEELPQSKVYIVSDAAHRVHLDKPGQIADILKSLE